MWTLPLLRKYTSKNKTQIKFSSFNLPLWQLYIYHSTKAILLHTQYWQQRDILFSLFLASRLWVFTFRLLAHACHGTFNFKPGDQGWSTWDLSLGNDTLTVLQNMLHSLLFQLFLGSSCHVLAIGPPNSKEMPCLLLVFPCEEWPLGIPFRETIWLWVQQPAAVDPSWILSEPLLFLITLPNPVQQVDSTQVVWNIGHAPQGIHMKASIHWRWQIRTGKNESLPRSASIPLTITSGMVQQMWELDLGSQLCPRQSCLRRKSRSLKKGDLVPDLGCDHSNFFLRTDQVYFNASRTAWIMDWSHFGAISME